MLLSAHRLLDMHWKRKKGLTAARRMCVLDLQWSEEGFRDGIARNGCFVDFDYVLTGVGLAMETRGKERNDDSKKVVCRTRNGEKKDLETE